MTQHPRVRPANGARMHSVADVAELLNVSPMTVRRLIDRGELRAFQISPRIIRVRHDALVDYMQAVELRGTEGGKA